MMLGLIIIEVAISGQCCEPTNEVAELVEVAGNLYLNWILNIKFASDFVLGFEKLNLQTGCNACL